MSRRLDIPAAWSAKEPGAQEDFRRLRRVLEQLQRQMEELEDRIARAGGSLTVQRNGATVGAQSKINFIEGADTTLTVANDSGNNRINVTVAANIPAPVDPPDPTVSEFWATPDASLVHADNDEFADGSTINARWTLFDVTAAMNPISPTYGIVPNTTPAANTIRIDHNHARSRSWIKAQVAAPTAVGFLGRRIASRPADVQFRARLSLAGYGSSRLMVVTESAGKPNFTSIGSTSADQVSIGWLTHTGNVTALAYTIRVGGASPTGFLHNPGLGVNTRTGGNNGIYGQDVEVIITFSGTTCTLYERSAGFSRWLETRTTTNMGTGGVLWVGWIFHPTHPDGSTFDSPNSMVQGCDYIRQENSSLVYL